MGAGLISGRGVRASHCSGLSARGARAPGRSSLPLGLGCPVACGIFPGQGANLCLLHWQVDPLPLSATREALLYVLNVLSLLSLKGQSKYKLDYQPDGTETRWQELRA